MRNIFFILSFFATFNAYADISIDKVVINEMLTTVNNEYLHEVDLNKVATDGLKAINNLDSNIVITQGISKFYIYYKRQIKKIVPLPNDKNSVVQWADTLVTILNACAKNSEKVALKDYELPDLMMKNIASGLDEYSRYYSEFDFDDNEGENAIYTLYSDRKIDNILYLKVRVFNQQTARQIETSLKNNMPYDGVIIDLRGNSGGILNEALKTADFFTDNEIITYTSGRNGKNTHYYTSQSGELFAGPLVIIVDGDTASASEVLAGGLQEQSRAKIIGTRTFGKGTIQNVTRMSNGGRLALTSEQFFTPSGKAIHHNGIIPDVCLSLNNGICKKESRLNNDDDLSKAINLIKNEL